MFFKLQYFDILFRNQIHRMPEFRNGSRALWRSALKPLQVYIKINKDYIELLTTKTMLKWELAFNEIVMQFELFLSHLLVFSILY